LRSNVFSPASSAARIALLFLGLAGLAILSGNNSSAQQPAQQAAQQPDRERLAAGYQRRALDDLSPDERAAAERVARSDSRVKELLGEAGVRVVSVTPVLIKTEAPEKTDIAQRQVEVVLFHPQREVGARVIVHLQQNRVAVVNRLASNEVMLTNDDLADAVQLALRDPEVVKSLGAAASTFHIAGAPTATAVSQNVVEGLPVRSEEASDPCSKHRCLALLFRRGNDYLIEPSVVVDLTAKHVMIEKRNPQRKADHER